MMGGRGSGAIPARRHIPTGALELVQRDGRMLLRQADAEIDVTDVIVLENHPMGRLVLGVRRTADRSRRAQQSATVSAKG